MTIIPAILSDSTTVVQEQLDAIATHKSLNRVQIDIIDPDFAPEITISPIDLTGLDIHQRAIDIHLMTNDPINDVVECTQVPGIHTIIGQVEHMASQQAFIDHVKSYDLKVGLSLDLTTPIEALDQFCLVQLDTIQVMGIHAGAQGRPFAGEMVVEKIKELRSLLPMTEIVVDGGMTPSTWKVCQAAGATAPIVGSHLEAFLQTQ